MSTASLSITASDVFAFIKRAIKDMALEHEQVHNPAKYIKRVLNDAELHLHSALDSVSIFNENRLRVHLLIHSLNKISGFTSPIYSLPKRSATIPITQITQIRCSKSDSGRTVWSNIYDFGKETYENCSIKQRDNIDALINHFMRGESELQVSHYYWNNQILWENIGGSHNFAITYYHAVNQGLQIEIPVQITPYIFDYNIYSSISKEYSIFLTHEKNLQPIYDLKWKYHFEVTQFDYPMHGSKNVIFFIPTSTNVAQVLKSEYNHYFVHFHRVIESL